MRLTTSVVALSLAAVIGCGTSDSDKNKDNETNESTKKPLTAEQQAEKEKTGKDLPEGTIMIAEVNEDGDVVGEPKLRTVNANLTGKSQEELIRLFAEEGKEIKSVIENTDNLDSESSTQSWWGWRHRRGYRCGNWNYCNYRPRCHYRSYNYHYQSAARYQVQGYIPAYHMPYQTYQGFQSYEGFRAGYGASDAGYGGFQGGYQPYYQGGAQQYPAYGGYQGSESAYQVYGWNRSFNSY